MLKPGILCISCCSRCFSSRSTWKQNPLSSAGAGEGTQPLTGTTHSGRWTNSQTGKPDYTQTYRWRAFLTHGRGALSNSLWRPVVHVAIVAHLRNRWRWACSWACSRPSPQTPCSVCPWSPVAAAGTPPLRTTRDKGRPCSDLDTTWCPVTSVGYQLATIMEHTHALLTCSGSCCFTLLKHSPLLFILTPIGWFRYPLFSCFYFILLSVVLYVDLLSCYMLCVDPRKSSWCLRHQLMWIQINNK